MANGHVADTMLILILATCLFYTVDSKPNVVADGNFSLPTRVSPWHIHGVRTKVVGGGISTLETGGRVVQNVRNVRMPAVLGESLSQRLSTIPLSRYRADISIRSSLLHSSFGGEVPSELALTVTDVDGTLIFWADMRERMTRAWTTKTFEFVAESPVSILSFSSSTPNGTVSLTEGTGIASVTVTEVGRALQSRMGKASNVVHLSSETDFFPTNLAKEMKTRTSPSTPKKSPPRHPPLPPPPPPKKNPLTPPPPRKFSPSPKIPTQRPFPPPRVSLSPSPPHKKPYPSKSSFAPLPKTFPPPPIKKPSPSSPPLKRSPPPKKIPSPSPPTKRPPPPPPPKKKPPPPSPPKKRPPPPRPPTKRPPPPRPPTKKPPPPSPPKKKPPPPSPPKKRPPPPRPPTKRPPPPRPPTKKPPPPSPPKKKPPPPSPPKKRPPPPPHPTKKPPPPPPIKRRPPPPPPIKSRPPPPPPIKRRPPPPPPRNRFPPGPPGGSRDPDMVLPPFPSTPPQSSSLFFSALPPPLLVSFNGDNLRFPNSATVVTTFNSGGGARWQTFSYTSGLFQGVIRCPIGNPDGILTQFYLESHPDTGGSQGIGLDFPGNSPTTMYATWKVNGFKTSVPIGLGFDCSAEDHLFSIYWGKDYSAWYIDRTIVYSKINTDYEPYVTYPLFLFGSIGDGSSINGGNYSGTLQSGTQATATFKALGVVSPVGEEAPAPPPTPLPQTPPPAGGEILTPTFPNYCGDHCLGCDPNNLNGNNTIRFDRYCGSRFQSMVRYPSAVISADIKCPANDTGGMITSFYMSTQEGIGFQDEIDWEFIGNYKHILQSNYFVNGVGGNEFWHDLGYDCSEAFHNYAIEWNEYNIIWYVDRKAVRVVANTAAADGTPYPTRPMYVYGSLWDASWICGGCWTGTRANYTLDPNWVWNAEYRNMRVLSPI